MIVNGAASGCIYGLIALGFVLIYKATEMVNFAQGDVMMLGGFVAFTLIANSTCPTGSAGCWRSSITAAFGYRARCRRPATSHRPAAIRRGDADPRALGFIFRAVAGITWGYDSVGFNTPFTNKTVDIGGLCWARTTCRSSSARSCCVACCISFFSRTRLGVAMQAASQNQLAAYYMGIPVRTIFSLIWAISAGVACLAGILLSPVSMIDVNMGVLGIKAFAAAVIGGFGSIPGLADRRRHRRHRRAVRRLQTARRFPGGDVQRRAAADAVHPAAGPVRRTHGKAGLTDALSVPDHTTSRTSRCGGTTATGSGMACWRCRAGRPAVLGEFYIGELGAVFIFAIAGVGLMLLVGYTGLISLGHAAFLGIGAYVNAVLLAQGVPFLVTLPLAGDCSPRCAARPSAGRRCA